ncbi:MAG TPA: hypothetical protein VKA82_02795 [Rubrobacter sp.]|nr:hypothetical protein [Rubrobacter sp.]
MVSSRKNGRLRVTPVSPLAGDGERYVVTIFDEADWIKNVRTAGWRLLSRAAGGAGDAHRTVCRPRSAPRLPVFRIGSGPTG